MVCNKQLSTGEELYIIDENKFVCKEDYLNSPSLKEGSLNSGMEPGQPGSRVQTGLPPPSWHTTPLLPCSRRDESAGEVELCFLSQ